MQPVLFRVYGIAEHDFSACGPDDLAAVDREAALRRWTVVAALRPGPRSFDALPALLARYAEQRVAGRLAAVAGFAVGTGPGPRDALLADCLPGPETWDLLAASGSSGLRYVVLAPDVRELDDRVAQGRTLRSVVTALTEGGVRIVLGRCVEPDSEAAARRVRALVDLLAPGGSTPSPALLADLPDEVTHPRAAAVLLDAAREQRLSLCVDFGDDARSAGVAAVSRSVGVGNVVAVTDHTESGSRGAEDHRPSTARKPGEGGVVAQIRALRGEGFTETAIEKMCGDNARLLLTG
ncbi:hypothetical protein ACWDR5_27975 [Streptomyces koyangensis]|uniref:hypothetical protein n=1 Tax=Streptomyces koyangensis TaxID=188770 RepID=UPI003C2C7200